MEGQRDNTRAFKWWTMKDVEYLRSAYKVKTERQIAKDMGLTSGQVAGAISRYNLRADRDARFSKGHSPWNKGKYHRTSPETEFKNGSLPANTKHDGAISIRADKRGIKYKFIRVSLAKWVPLHRYLWTEANGPIPYGMVLVFKDKDTDNCTLSNLELITRKENITRNRNRKKAANSLRALWHTEKLRQVYGLPPKTGLGKVLQKKVGG